MTDISANILTQIDALQASYVHALDNRNFSAWVGCFDGNADASYFCIAAENVENNLPIALMYDDNLARIRDRVTYIEEIWAGTFQDYRTRHFLQRTHCEQTSSDSYAVETNFLIILSPEAAKSDLQVAGVYKDEITINGSGARFKCKKAIYDTTILPRYIVYPF